LRRYRDFCDFADGGCRHLEFSQIRNFNGLSAVRGQCASVCQISSKSVKQLQRYGDLTVFKMAAVRHLGFVKFEILHFASAYQISYGDIAIFAIFQDGGHRHLEFSKIRNFNALSAVRGQ